MKKNNTSPSGKDARTLMKGSIIDNSHKNAVGLPTKYQPNISPVNGSEGAIKAYILPDNTTGVVSSFIIL